MPKTARRPATRRARTAAEGPARKLWLAALGVAAKARARGETAIESVATTRASLVGEAARLRGRVEREAKRVRGDVEKQVRSVVRPVRQRAQRVARKIESRAAARIGAMLGRFGVPSRADVAELTQRVDALNRRIRAARPRRA